MINPMIILILVAIGLLTGGLAGIMGISGGVILIPALIYLLGLNHQQATGTSLAVLLPPIGFFAAYNYYKAGYVNNKLPRGRAIEVLSGIC